MKQETLFGEIARQEQSRKDEESFVENTKLYRRWLAMPDKIVCLSGSPERANVRGEMEAWSYKLYQHAYHECSSIPDDGTYIWLNHIAWENGEYWVISKHGTVMGEHIRQCPFCGADLSAGQGDVALYKADVRYWFQYLYWDTPRHEGRPQTPEEREKIKATWG